MAKVLTHMCMSLDGFVAQPDDTPAELFDWYWIGDVVVPSAQESMSFSVDAASAPMLREPTSCSRTPSWSEVPGRSISATRCGADTRPPPEHVTTRYRADGAGRQPAPKAAAPQDARQWDWTNATLASSSCVKPLVSDRCR